MWARRDHGKAYSMRGQLFDGYVGSAPGRQSIETAVARCLSGSRWRGVDLSTRVVMRHAGYDHDALRSTVVDEAATV
jgi:hypothetical protein